MATNHDLMRQKLERLKTRREVLRIEAAGLARDIPLLINPELDDIEDMDIARAASKMDDLVMRQGELLGMRQKIWALEEQIGR